jgi:hypothetical protein
MTSFSTLIHSVFTPRRLAILVAGAIIGSGIAQAVAGAH